MKKVYTLFIILLVTEIIVAIICGPNSCEWGNGVYFYFGIAGLAFSCVLPLFQKAWNIKKSIVYSFLFMLIFIIIWVTGFVLCGFRIVCRLF